jgi:hypothetical protein
MLLVLPKSWWRTYVDSAILGSAEVQRGYILPSLGTIRKKIVFVIFAGKDGKFTRVRNS